MTDDQSKTVPLLGLTAAALAPSAPAAQAPLSVADLIAKIKSSDDAVRGPAWQGAAPYGAQAIKPLAAVMTDPDFETARCARRALWVIVRHAGRRGAGKEAKAVENELLSLLAGQPAGVRREVLWMLSEIAGNDAIEPMAALLSDLELREDARCALLRLPGGKVTKALKQALASAPEDFKYALADSLRARGEKVAGYPSRKLVPTKPTSLSASKTA